MFRILGFQRVIWTYIGGLW